MWIIWSMAVLLVTISLGSYFIKHNQTKYNKNTGSVAFIRSDACYIYLKVTFCTYKMQQFLKVRYSY